MANKKFESANNQFWSKFKEPNSGEFLLVETSTHPVINHSNAVVAKIVAKAKNLQIAWLINPNTDIKLLKSYSPNSVFINIPKIKPEVQFYLLILSLFYFFQHVLLTNKLLSFSYKNVRYGDFVYDGYLAGNKMATLHRFDPRMVLTFFQLLLNDTKARFILSQYSVKAVLISHYIGLETGPLTRVVLQAKIPVYWKGGGHEIINLSVFKNLNQIYNYPKKPSLKIIKRLITKHQAKIEAEFDKLIKDLQKSDNFNPLSVAYKNKVFNTVNRKDFLKKMKLNDKPIIFIMLHAFNDHPHSHFKKMLFKDYYDWFIQTLKFAQQDSSKNWIFKEHPASDLYPTKDLDLKKMMKNLPQHVKFVSRKNYVNAATVLNVADLIVTCLGTAGVEMPALKGIPVIIAGESSYSGLDFTLEPHSKKQYFEILRRSVPKPLSSQKQLKAKCCYLYSNKYCVMPFAAGPSTTFEENTNPHKLKNSYFDRILAVYKNKSKIIYRQFQEYVRTIRKNDFQSLNRIPLH